MDDDIDPRDFVARQRLQQLVYRNTRIRNVEQAVFMIDKEMVVGGRVCVEE
jgi:hypothetical protein